MKKEKLSDNEHGFSLVELIIAMALLGILTSIAVLGFSQYKQKADLRTIARKIQGDITATKMMTVSQARKHQIVYSKDAGSYSIYKRKADDSDWEESPLKTISLNTAEASGVSFTFSGTKSIAFLPRGILDGSSDVTITITNGAGKTAEVKAIVNGKVYVNFP